MENVPILKERPPLQSSARGPVDRAVPLSSFPVVGSRVSAVTLDHAVEWMTEAIEHRRRDMVCVASVNMVMTARTDATLREAMEQAGMVTPDGYPLTWLGRRRASGPVGRVRGTDLVHAMCARAVDDWYKSFFIGGAEGVPERMAQELVRRYPGLQVAGTHSPPFRPPTGDEEQALAQQINDSGADIVWVGLGCPKQEQWMLRNRSRLDAPLLVGVGAAFDFIAGTKGEAPRAVQKVGLEWLWRFVSEPRRLWRRVIVEGPQFVTLAALEKWRRPAADGAADSGLHRG